MKWFRYVPPAISSFKRWSSCRKSLQNVEFGINWNDNSAFYERRKPLTVPVIRDTVFAIETNLIRNVLKTRAISNQMLFDCTVRYFPLVEVI